MELPQLERVRLRRCDSAGETNKACLSNHAAKVLLMQHRDEGRNNSTSSDAKKNQTALLRVAAAQVQVSKNNDESLEIQRAE